MPTAAEMLNSPTTPLERALDKGVETLALRQTIVFTKYLRTVLPIDGMVFWVRADLVRGDHVEDRFQIGPQPDASDVTISVPGSLHYATSRRHGPDATQAISTMIFTSEELVQPLNNIASNVMWIGEFEGIKFSFVERSSYYQQANLHHYVGEAIWPTLESQIIDDLTRLKQLPIISTSLPIWLGMNAFGRVYPAFLVPTNLRPPYITAHVQPNSTRALQSAPYSTPDGQMWLLVAEQVRITLWGFDNDRALRYLRYIEQESLARETFGFMSMPAIRDELVPQPELATVAMKKTIDLRISYNQAHAYGEARRVIMKSLPTFYPSDTTPSGSEYILDASATLNPQD